MIEKQIFNNFANNIKFDNTTLNYFVIRALVLCLLNIARNFVLTTKKFDYEQFTRYDFTTLSGFGSGYFLILTWNNSIPK